MKELKSWKELEKELHYTKQEDAEFELEYEIIKAAIEARKRCNVSQSELAERTGIKQPNINRIETGKVIPKVSTIVKYLDAIDYKLTVVRK